MIMGSAGIVPVHDMGQDLKAEFGVFIKQIGADAGVRAAIGGDEVVVHQQVMQFCSHRIASRRAGVSLEDATAVGGEFIERISHVVSLDLLEF